MDERIYTASDAVVDALIRHGVTNIFGYPGGAILPFYDALPHHPELKHILVRHEQGAAFMAQGYARSTGNLGVCCATSGPGGTNLITGIADAYMDSIPLLCLTGQVPLKMIGNDMFQEVDMVGITMNITKHNYLIEKIEDLVPIVTEAITIATSGRPGPVHVDMPKDIMAKEHPKNFEIPEIDLSETDPMLKAYHPLDLEVLEKIFEALKKAKKPVLLVGQGVKHSGAERELEDFIQSLGIPCVSTLLAKGSVNPENPNYLGMLGMHGFYHSNMAIHHADLILNIGSRFDDRIVGRYDVFGKGATLIHVDIDAAEHNKVVSVDYPVLSDAKLFLEQALVHPGLKRLSIDPWRKEIENWKNTHPYEENTDSFTMRKVYFMLKDLIEKEPNRYILVTDVGQHQMWASLSLPSKNAKNWICSGGSGTMGFALPVAIGAAFAHPEKTILCISGDGGIQMNLQELALLKDHDLDVKVLILNNSFLGMVRQWQELFYENNYSQVEISSPNYELLAKAYGIEGHTVHFDQDLDLLHQYIFSSRKPMILDYHVEKEDNVFPMVPGGKTLGETINH